MLSHEETMRLLSLAADGDDNATERLIAENTPLLKSIVKRYMGKHIEYDDLFQIAGIGLLKAIKNFKQDFNVRFSTYAVPMILGEIKRQMRDDGYIKVSRSVKSEAARINAFVEQYRQDHSRAPTTEEISERFGIEEHEAVFIMDSAKMPVSIYESADDEENHRLIDKIAAEENENDNVDKIMLKDMIDSLSERDKKIILLRYFRGSTQCEVARTLGVSQVQVSRLENKILDLMKAEFEKSDGA